MAKTTWYETHMTSNTTPVPFVASASSQYTGTGDMYAWKAFNGTTVDEYDRWRSANSGSSTSEWIQLDFGEKKYVNIFKVTSVNYATTLEGTPKTYSLKGSNDNVSWYDIGEFTTSNFVANESKDFILNSVHHYRYYRLVVSNKQGSVDYFNIGDIKFGCTILNKSLILHDGEYKKYEVFTSEDTVVPRLTGDSLNIIASDQLNPAWYSFDGVPSSTGKYWGGNGLGYLGYNFNKETYVDTVVIMGRNVNSDDFKSMPKSFVFQGSNDLSTWFDIKIFSNITWTTGGANTDKKLFYTSNDTAYKAYRIKYLELADSTVNISSLGELEFRYSKNKPSWQDISSTLPTQEQFLAEGMDSLSPLLDRRVETLEPLPMTGRSDILQTGEEGKVFSRTIDLKKYIDLRSIDTEVR